MTTPLTNPRQIRLLSCLAYTPGLEDRVQTDQNSLSGGVDISNYISEINIFESVFDNTLSGHITMTDVIGLPEYLPFVGIEYIFLWFAVDITKPGVGVVSQEFQRIFQVVGLRDQMFIKNERRMYTIDIVTPEFVQSISSRLHKTYNDTTCAEGIKRVLTEELGIKETQLTDIEATPYKHTVSIPNYTPLGVINWFTIHALSNQKDSCFMFYETLKGFHFNSLRTMIAAEPGVTFDVNEGGVSFAENINDIAAFNSIIRIHQEKSFNVLEDIAGGVLRSRVLHLDFLARQYRFDDHNYTDSFETGPHMDKFPLYPKNYDKLISRNVKLFVIPSTAWSNQSQYVAANQDTIDDELLRISVDLRNRQLKTLRHIKTLLEVPGQSDIRAGSTVIVNYPSSRALEGSTDSSSKPLPVHPTRYYSGKHLVTSVRHIITRQDAASLQYTMQLEVCRDSFGGPLTEFPDVPGDQ